jgi:hypothetical protein
MSQTDRVVEHEVTVARNGEAIGHIELRRERSAPVTSEMNENHTGGQ